MSTEASTGLSEPEVVHRLTQDGPNSLPEPKRRGPGLRLVLQFHNPLIDVLLVAGAVTFGLKDYVDAGVIAGVVLVNALIGFIQEGKGEQALETVRAMLATRATVLRDGELHEIGAAELLPGDIVLLEPGVRIPPDPRLVQVINLRIHEAAPTGESVPVDKDTQAVAQDAPIGDRTCTVYSGMVLSFGQAQGVVVGTGQQTEIGRIGAMVGEVQSLDTPLTRWLDQFTRQITLFILAARLITFLFGYFVREMPLLEIFLAVVGLSVAAIPEGLPAIVTIVLAIGTRTMARNKAIIGRLPAVETLGSVTVICSDKAGTLTKNEMTAVQVMPPGYTLAVSSTGYAPDGGFHQGNVGIDASQDAALQALVQCAALCNDACLKHKAGTGWHLVGDPTEGSLLTLAHKAGLGAQHAAAATPRIDEIPFESEHRFMATLHHDHDGHAFAYLKGAPERVLNLCQQNASGQPVNPATWQARMEDAAAAHWDSARIMRSPGRPSSPRTTWPCNVSRWRPPCSPAPARSTSCGWSQPCRRRANWWPWVTRARTPPAKPLIWC